MGRLSTFTRGVYKYISAHGIDSRLEKALKEAKANIESSTVQLLEI
jgi:hypothetical protein